MSYKNLNDFILRLEAEGELVRIKEYVSPELEITEIYDRIIKSDGPALLFENNGTPFPLLINAFGKYKRICIALGVKDINEIGEKIEDIFKEISKHRTGFAEKIKALPFLNKLSSWMPGKIKGKGACQDFVITNPDITKLPVLKCWPYDGGHFITLPIVHTNDPETGQRNVGMYRMQVFGPRITGMHWHIHKGSAKHYRKYAETSSKMPVSVVLGGDPVYTYVATAPLPDNIDEYILAGFLRGKKVDLVKCITNDIEVPADADFVIEGYIDTCEDLYDEGPFGDHTGFYSLSDKYPAFHITCITHRANAVYPTTVVGIPPQEDCWMGKATERLFLKPIRLSMLPELINMNMPFEGVFHNIVIVSIKNEFPGQTQRVMNSLWGAGQMMFNKIMIVVDHNVDVNDYIYMARLFTKHFNPNNDLLLSKGPLDVLDHAADKYAYGGKAGFDLTVKALPESEKINIPQEKIVKELFPEIVDVNIELFKLEISIVLLSVIKENHSSIRSIADKIMQVEGMQDVKMLVFTEQGIDLHNFSDVVWFVANNIDASRDISVVKNKANNKATLVIDGTIKTFLMDDFNRPWPNILCMSDEIIEKVDNIWGKLNLGNLIKSPSLKYKSLVRNNGAVRE